jgi:GT2 family glycosyltransferase
MQPNPGLGAALAVVVVYKRPWLQVHGANLLEAALAGGCDPEGRMLPRLGRLLIYDNSPAPLGRPDVAPANCDYVHDASNGGTRAAYSRALQLAHKYRLSWVILLDHDTTLPAAYFHELDQKIAQSSDRSLGLLFPRVIAGHELLSPARINRWGTVVALDRRPTPLDAKGSLTAVASGAAIRVDALEAVGDIPRQLWLDYLDHWLFRQAQKLGYRAECMSSTLRHDLSIRGPRVPGRERHCNILRAERYFTDALGLSARAVYPFRLMRRALKMLPRDAGAAWLIVRHALPVRSIR